MHKNQVIFPIIISSVIESSVSQLDYTPHFSHPLLKCHPGGRFSMSLTITFNAQWVGRLAVLELSGLSVIGFDCHFISVTRSTFR